MPSTTPIRLPTLRSPSEGRDGRAKHSRAASPDSPPTGGHWAGSGFGAPTGRSPRLGRSPSSDWDCFSLEEWDTEEDAADSSAAVAGAATLLAAAAEVESREAAAAAAATSTGAGRAGPSQRGGSGAASHTHSPAGRALPDSPGGSATGSSLSPPPADASHQVQAFLHGFLRAAQATGASAPTVPAVLAAGVPAAAAGSAAQAAGRVQGAALPSFLTPQQLDSVSVLLILTDCAVGRVLRSAAACFGTRLPG